MRIMFCKNETAAFFCLEEWVDNHSVFMMHFDIHTGSELHIYLTDHSQNKVPQLLFIALHFDDDG